MHSLIVRDLSKAVPNKILFEDISFAIRQGEKVALVAENWAGKSTLLKILSWLDHQDSGDIELLSDTHIWYLSQDNDFDPQETGLQALFYHDHELGQLIRQYEDYVLWEVILDDEAVAHLLEEMNHCGARDYHTKVQTMIGKLNLTPLLPKQIKHLSWWEKKRISLAKVLLREPNFLILDEPTNHLDIAMIRWLETYLRHFHGSVVLVTHDRWFLDRVTSKIFEISGGYIYSYTGTYARYLELRAKRLEDQKKKMHEMKKEVRSELERYRKQPRGRQTKSALRSKEFEALESKYKRMRREGNEMDIELEISMAERRLWSKVMKTTALTKWFERDIKTDTGVELVKQYICNKFDIILSAGERIGIVWPNGAGKSTFAKLIMWQIEPDLWSITVWETVTMWYYSQWHIEFDHDMRVIDVIKQVAEYIYVSKWVKFTASQMLERFMFDGRKQQQRARTLSGGELRRLGLLRVLIANPNFLILDEPTNDLDLATLTILENFLVSYSGTLMIVSHDRYFMNRLVDHLLVFEWNGKITDYRGTYAEREKNPHGISKSEAVVEEKKDEPDDTYTQQAKAVVNTPPKKLSNKERAEFAKLEKDIVELELRRDDINIEFQKWTLDNDMLVELSKELTRVSRELEEKEERWMELWERV